MTAYLPTKYESIRHFGTLVGVHTNEPKNQRGSEHPCIRCGTRRQVHDNRSKVCDSCYSTIRAMGPEEMALWLTSG